MERFIHEPGNGTRYDLLYQEEPDGYIFLAWMHRGGSGGSCIRIRCGIEATYMMEKMRLSNRPDANALLAFLKARGYPATLDPGYNEDGVYEAYHLQVEGGN